MTEALLADYGIRQLHARFADAVFRQDYDGFAGCFSEGGVWKIAGMRLEGRAAVREAAERLLGRCERIQLAIGQPILAVGEGEANGRVQVTEFARKKDGTAAITFGVYHDRYVRDGEEWRFTWRHWAMAYHGPTDLSGDFVVPPDFGPFPAMPADDAPTHVRKA